MNLETRKLTEVIDADAKVIAVSKENKEKEVVKLCDKKYLGKLNSLKSSKYFNAESGTELNAFEDDLTLCFLGLGDKKSISIEHIRNEWASYLKKVQNKYKTITVDIASFCHKNKLKEDQAYQAIVESTLMTLYTFDKYMKKVEVTLENIYFLTETLKNKSKIFEKTKFSVESINFTRDLINNPPNFLNSEKFASIVQEDVKSNLKSVKTKILDKKMIQKENMNLFLSVNAGSAFEPRLVYLDYRPKNMNSKTKHVSLVGKGITFDTGGYSLKPSGSMVGMKFDMGGAATVYGAFRSAVLQKPKIRISCLLAMTDNAVNSLATTPDSIVKGRSGKTVEILNTDAEGRLILADALDYACDLKPDEIIDAATLTGACLVAVGSETCAIMGNDQKLVNNLIKKSQEIDESMWQLPIHKEHAKDMKSKVADLKNIGASRFAGTTKAAAFLREFIKDDISWAHLDIAGIASDQKHLSYCPPVGASGLIVRTLSNYLLNE